MIRLLILFQIVIHQSLHTVITTKMSRRRGRTNNNMMISRLKVCRESSFLPLIVQDCITNGSFHFCSGLQISNFIVSSCLGAITYKPPVRRLFSNAINDGCIDASLEGIIIIVALGVQFKVFVHEGTKVAVPHMAMNSMMGIFITTRREFFTNYIMFSWLKVNVQQCTVHSSPSCRRSHDDDCKCLSWP